MSALNRRPLVVVTRAAEQSGGLSDRLLRAGYDVLEVPVIEIVDAADGGVALAAALQELGSYDWVVVTSPNGATRVSGALMALEAGNRPRTAVVGPGTEAALGVPADPVAGSSIGEGLVEDFPVGTGRVLLVQAEAARAVVAEGLRVKGWAVDAVVGYRTVAAVPNPALVAEATQADAIVFTSGSTVRHFVSAAGATGLPRLTVSIGPATSAVAEELGVPVTITATLHNLDGVVEALGSVLAPAPMAAPRPQQRS
jgi:uroporphyrinogen-III synthase